MDNGGYWMKTGSWNYFEIDRIFYNKLSITYSDCLQNINAFRMNKTLIDYISKSNRLYRQTDCFFLCSRLFALENSNCSYNTSSYNFDRDFKKRYSSASYDTNHYKECLETYLTRFRKNVPIFVL